jgi:hypothetical protein
MEETTDELFPTTPDAVWALLAEVRRLVRDAIPGATETFYHGALEYGPNGSRSDRILYIAPQNGYVNLGFFFGVGTPDPTGLLEGSGKRMRHVKIKTVLAAQHLALAPLIQESWANGVKVYAQFHEARRKRREPVAERKARVWQRGRGAT